MFLDKIVTHKKQEIEDRKRTRGLLEVKRKAQDKAPSRNFLRALRENGKKAPRIIAEIKKASPSRGIIRKDFHPREIAIAYQEAGAVAISVLTDNKFFQGDLGYLSLVRENTEIPILCKDFILDPYQIYEAAVCGADAFLLIAALLSHRQIEEFLSLGNALGMEALVEIHSREELEKVLLTSATIIGINNRDLKTFKTDIRTTLTLMKFIPAGKLVVSESGIHDREHIKELEAVGVNAFLIGEALMKEEDPGKKLRELRGEA